MTIKFDNKGKRAMSKCVNAVRLMSSTFHYISHLLFLSNLENYLSNCTCNRHPRSPKETGRHTGRRMKDQLPPHRSWIRKIEKQIINTYNSNKRQTFLFLYLGVIQGKTDQKKYGNKWSTRKSNVRKNICNDHNTIFEQNQLLLYTFSVVCGKRLTSSKY